MAMRIMTARGRAAKAKAADADGEVVLPPNTLPRRANPDALVGSVVTADPVTSARTTTPAPRGPTRLKAKGRGAVAKANNPAKAQPAPPPPKAAQNADPAKGKGKKGKRARSRSATPAGTAALAPTKPRTELSGERCTFASAGKGVSSGRT